MDIESKRDETGSAVDRTTARLEQMVAQGRLVGGQALIESDLCTQFEVARGTLRECLRRLENRGLVVARARGLQIRWLSRKDVADLFELRELLEGAAAARAARSFADAPQALQERLHEEMRFWQINVDSNVTGSFSERNRQFHDFIVALCGNVHLPRMLDQTLLLLFASQFRAWMPAQSYSRASIEHLEILQAVESGDAVGAEQAMRSHIRNSAIMNGQLPDDAFAPP